MVVFSSRDGCFSPKMQRKPQHLLQMICMENPNLPLSCLIAFANMSQACALKEKLKDAEQAPLQDSTQSDRGNIGDCHDCQMNRCETYCLFLVLITLFRRAWDSDVLPDACQEVSLFSTLLEALEYFGKANLLDGALEGRSSWRSFRRQIFLTEL